MDCSRVYLGDLTGDLRRAVEESERAASVAQEAGVEAKNAETGARELEAAAEEKEREARNALVASERAQAAAEECEAADRSLLECARLKSDASTADTQAFIAEQDAQEATRDAERARSRASGAAERAAAADRNMEEGRSEVARLRATKQRMEACSAQDAEPAAPERAQPREATVSTGGMTGFRPVTGATAGRGEDGTVLLAVGRADGGEAARPEAGQEWAEILTNFDVTAFSRAVESCEPLRAGGTVLVTISASVGALKGMPNDELAELFFKGAERAREVSPEAFDIALLRVSLDGKPLDEIKRDVSRLDRRIDAEHEIRRDAAERWATISRRAVLGDIDRVAALSASIILAMLTEDEAVPGVLFGGPDSVAVGLEFLRSLIENAPTDGTFSPVWPEDLSGLGSVCYGFEEAVAAR